MVDTGTNDETAAIVESYKRTDSRIRFFHITNGKGISLARNLALREAKGQYVAFLDSDDLWLPSKLELQLAFMRTAKTYFSCTGYRRINKDGSKLGQLRLPPPVQTYQNLLMDNQISCPTVVFDQQKLGPFQMPEHPHEDYILWLEIIKRSGTCLGLQEDLARYRIIENSRSMNVNRPGSRWRVYRDFEKLNFLSASYYFCIYGLTAIMKRIQH